MSRVQFLLDKQEKLKDILSAAWGQEVRIFIFDGSAEGSEDSEFEIILSVEGEVYMEVMVCVTQKGINLPPPASPTECLDFLLKLASKLEQLLGCRANYVDKDGLKSWYPKTYRHRFSIESG